MKIAIGGDHAGYQLKEKLKSFLNSLNHEFIDFGPQSEESCDYPDIAHPIARSIATNECDLGIAICGSGNGINMTVNKHKDVRSALCWNVELAELARQHNNANVLSIPSRFISEEMALNCVKAFLETEFEGGRHERRVNKINI